ncbi:hypothetical protein GCM10027416_23820 [Okibacterium endophyticum]
MRFTRLLCCAAAGIVLTIGVSGCLPPGIDGAPGPSGGPGAGAGGPKPVPALVDALPDALLTEVELAAVGEPGAATWIAGRVVEKGPATPDDAGADPVQTACEGDFELVGGEQVATAGRVLERDGGAIVVTQSLVVLQNDPVDVLARLRAILAECGETPTSIEGEQVSMTFDLLDIAALGDASLAARMTARWPDARSFDFDVILVAANGVYLSLLVTAPYAVLEFRELEAMARLAVAKVDEVV